ncbi:MAG: nucleotidyltransferase domain-containing protein [Nanoarchaeota archaeon]
MEYIIKPTRVIGNASGVILPKEWKNSLIRAEIITKPLNEYELLKLIENEISIKKIMGIYLIGSYARGDYDNKSDIDILVINKDINKTMKLGKYEINILSLSSLEYLLKYNCIPVLPWIVESVSIINDSLLDKYKNTKLTLKNLKWHIETNKTSMNIIREKLKAAKKYDDYEYICGCSYSLVLRLRTLYAIECLIKKKIQRKSELISLIEKISGSRNIYDIYLDNKLNIDEDIKDVEKVSYEGIKSILDYIVIKNKEIEKWLKEKKD